MQYVLKDKKIMLSGVSLLSNIQPNQSTLLIINLSWVIKYFKIYKINK